MFIYPGIPRGRHFWGWSGSSAMSPGALFPQPLTSVIHSLPLSKPSAAALGTRGALEAGEGAEQASSPLLAVAVPRTANLPQKVLLGLCFLFPSSELDSMATLSCKGFWERSAYLAKDPSSHPGPSSGLECSHSGQRVGP